MTSKIPRTLGEYALRRRLGMIAAFLLAACLVGSFLIVITLAHQSKSAAANSSTSHTQTIPSQLGVYVGSGDGALYKLDATNGQQLWRYKTQGRSIAAPAAVANGVAYTGSQDGFVYALNVATGKLIWKFQTRAAIVASPVAANGVVYIGSSDGNLYALKSSSGSLVWQYHPGPGGVTVVVHTVVVINNVVYGSSYDGVEHSYLFAVDAKTGSQLWRTQINDQSFTDPQVVSGVVYIASWAIEHQGGPDIRDSYVYAFNAGNGKQIWRSDKVGDFILFAPTVANGVVYVGSRDTYLYALQAATGKRIWRYSAGGSMYTSPRVFNNVVYAGVIGTVTPSTTSSTSDTSPQNGYIIAVNATSGSLIWQHSLPNYQGTTLAVFDNVIYVGTEDNFVYALTTRDGSEIWQHKDSVGGAVLFTNAPIAVAP